MKLRNAVIQQKVSQLQYITDLQTQYDVGQNNLQPSWSMNFAQTHYQQQYSYPANSADLSVD